jgi:hypothetical protein
MRLLNLFKRIKANQASQNLDTSSLAGDIDSDDEYFETNINANDSSDSAQRVSDNDLIRKIRTMSSQDKVPFKTNILEYYQEKYRKKLIDEDLYKLALIVLSAPVTQVSVERSFSGLSGLLVQKRNQIADETISDVLLCNLNRDLIELVDFENMNL